MSIIATVEFEPIVLNNTDLFETEHEERVFMGASEEEQKIFIENKLEISYFPYLYKIKIQNG